MSMTDNKCVCPKCGEKLEVRNHYRRIECPGGTYKLDYEEYFELVKHKR